MKSDQELLKDIREELKWDPRLDAAEINVDVENGVATLSGHVDSYTKRMAAEEAAKRVKDVRGIVEEINVHLEPEQRRSDHELAETALNALKWNYSVPDEQITVEVDHGWLTLDGHVNWQFQKEAATNAVKDITGLKGVLNIVAVKPRVTEPVVRETIKKALERSAHIEANRITIETLGSKVILRGKAHSWNERNEVERAAWSAPGVAEVEDELVIA